VASFGNKEKGRGMKKNSRGPDQLVHVDIKAAPGAPRTELAGFKDGRLRVRIAAAPEDGKANGELCAFFAKSLGCPKRDIVLERGEKSRLKTLVFPAVYKVKFDELINALNRRIHDGACSKS
jgi:uncharacterized protein (TIGR00251 family)